jgi:hypothetical protein
MQSFEGIQVFRSIHKVKKYFPIYFLTAFFTFNKSVQEALIGELSQTMKKYYDWDGQSVGFVMLSYAPLTLLLSLLPSWLNSYGKIQYRKIMLLFTTLSFIAMVLKINIYYNEPESVYYYIFSSGLLLSMTLSAEVSFVSLYGTITPDYINQSFWSAGMLSGLGDTGGRTLGNFDITIFSAIDGTRALSFWLYLCLGIIYLLLLVTAYVISSSLVLPDHVQIKAHDASPVPGGLKHDENLNKDGLVHPIRL